MKKKPNNNRLIIT